MLDWLRRLWNQGWPVIRGAPIQFAGAVLVITVLAFIGASAWFSRELTAVRAEKEVFRARIAGIEAELKQLQDQTSGVEYQKPNKSELRQQALELVSKLRDFIEHNIRSRDKTFFGHVATAASNIIGNPDEIPIDQALLYERKFKVRAKVLRDSILRQLPPSAFDEEAIRKYDELTITAIRAVANDLERLARQLNY